MFYKTTALTALICISITFVLVGSSVATTPIELSQGRKNELVDLDSGAKVSGYIPSTGHRSYVTPTSPQHMVLDPGILVHQAEKYNNEAKEILNRTQAIYNDTKELAANVEDNSDITIFFANESKKNAITSKNASDDAKKYLTNTLVIYNNTSKIYNSTADIYSLTVDLHNQTKELAAVTEEIKLEIIAIENNSLNKTNHDIAEIRMEFDSLKQNFSRLEGQISNLGLILFSSRISTIFRYDLDFN